MKALANTTILSNFTAVGRLDLIKRLHGRLYVTNEVYEEILDGLDEGYDFYAGIDVQIYPFAEDGWIELVSMVEEEELRLFRSLPRRLHRGEASRLGDHGFRDFGHLGAGREAGAADGRRGGCPSAANDRTRVSFP